MTDPPAAEPVKKTGPFRKRNWAPADDTTQLFVNGPFIRNLT
jgi:hypothetical protein